ncbi:MAG: methyl-accepting chemotaxis protein [Candidatus Omnitrophica bacterium]|nr:methyl-accepting chemotaxis protein [Candidatus Omnitrophota bacterium]
MRKRRLTKTRTQFQFLKLVLLGILLPTALLMACFYLFLSLLITNGILVHDFDYTTLGPQLLGILLVLFLGYVIISAGLITWTLIVSNRLCGPLHRLENELTKFVDGDQNVTVRFRESDDLDRLAHLVNTLIARARGIEGEAHQDETV